MAAGYVAGFVGQHADHLERVVGRHEKAGVQE